MRPAAASTWSRRAFTDPSEVMSAPMPTAPVPYSGATRAQAAPSTSVSTTRAPASARARQCSRPSRPRAPVTTATLPSSGRSEDPVSVVPIAVTLSSPARRRASPRRHKGLSPGRSGAGTSTTDLTKRSEGRPLGSPRGRTGGLARFGGPATGGEEQDPADGDPDQLLEPLEEDEGGRAVHRVGDARVLEEGHVPCVLDAEACGDEEGGAPGEG